MTKLTNEQWRAVHAKRDMTHNEIMSVKNPDMRKAMFAKKHGVPINSPLISERGFNQPHARLIARRVWQTRTRFKSQEDKDLFEEMSDKQGSA